MRVADPNPVYCSCCFQQQPAKLHIDFQVAWDGPVINEDGLRVPIDDLYLCEDCIESAYAAYRIAMGYKPITRLQRKTKKQHVNQLLQR